MKIEEAKPYLEKSLADLDAHMHASAAHAFSYEVRHAFRDDNTVLIQLWAATPAARFMNELYWDGIKVTYESREQVHALLEWLVLAEDVELSSGRIAPAPGMREPLFIPMYEFHPQRFRAVIPYAKEVAQHAQSGDMTMFTMEAIQGIAEFHMNAYNNALLQSPLRSRASQPMRMSQKPMEAANFYGQFAHCGRQIFDFPVSLAKSFRDTDVEDIPLSAIKLPYEAFYLHFGPQEDLETAPGWHPDGAYVVRSGDPNGRHAVQFCLTSLPADQAIYEDWVANPEPFYIQAVPSELLGTGIGEAVDRVLSDKIAELKRQAERSMQVTIDQAMEDIRAAGEDPGFDAKDVSSMNAKRELESLPGLHHAWREMLNLVINAIAYLSSYKEDIHTAWPKRTPTDLLEQCNEGTPKKKRTANSKLAALGYTAVHLCGKRFVEMVETAEAAAAAGGSEKVKKPTWVRGTWVWQPHGPKWSLRRLQWRLPHVRNKGEIDDDPDGHLYLVS